MFVNIIQNGQSAGIFYSANSGTSWGQMDLPLVPSTSPYGISGASNTSPIVITSSAPHGLAVGYVYQLHISGVNGNTAANGVWYAYIANTTQFSLYFSAGNGAYTSGGTWELVVGMNPWQLN